MLDYIKPISQGGWGVTDTLLANLINPPKRMAILIRKLFDFSKIGEVMSIFLNQFEAKFQFSQNYK